jgi:hypothetical protein
MKFKLVQLFSNLNRNKQQKKTKLMIGLIILLLIPFIGTTLAATVTISGPNNQTAIEFGQGSQVSVTCDTTITADINESWYSTSTIFQVSSIVLNGVNTTSALTATTNDQGCGGKTMIVKLFSGANGTTASTIGSDGSTSVSFTVPTSGTSITVSGSTGITGTASIAGGVGTFTLTLPTSSVHLDASTITRVSVETE